jgi:uncharacterized delta-60 repeat protein
MRRLARLVPLAALFVLGAALLDGAPLAATERPGSVDRDLPVVGGSTIESLTVTADGRIVVAGTMRSYFSSLGSWIRVHRSDGGLDSSFGTDGQVSLPPPADRHPPGDLVTVPQPDGRVLFAALRDRYRRPGGPPPFTLGRLTRTGEPDLEFGEGGSVTPTLGPGIEVTDFGLQPDGRIVAVGVRQDGIVLARLLPDGSFDRGLGDGGLASLPGESPNGAVVALQPGAGTIVLASTGAGPEIARFLAAGKIDPGFGSGPGLQPLAIGDRRVKLRSAPAALVLRDGRVRVLATVGLRREHGTRLAVVGLTRAGRPDPNFGRAGVAIASRPPASAQAIAADAAGGIYVAGEAPVSGDNAVAVVRRFLRDGRADPSFGRRGIVRLGRAGFGDAQYLRLAAQPDRRLLVADSGYSARYATAYTPLLRRFAAGYDRARPRLAINRRCRRSWIGVAVRIRDLSALERVVARVDGRRVRTTRRKRFRLRVRAEARRLSVTATDLAGNTRTRRIQLPACADR